MIRTQVARPKCVLDSANRAPAPMAGCLRRDAVGSSRATGATATNHDCAMDVSIGVVNLLPPFVALSNPGIPGGQT